MLNPKLKHKIQHNSQRALTSVRYVILAVFTGLVVGAVGILFYYALNFAGDLRVSHPWLIYLLPFAGLAIVGSYYLLHDEKDRGTNLVLSAIHSGDELPLRMAPLIFVSTFFTHLTGGSAGREGAALQIGASLGNGFSTLFHLNDSDKRVMMMCGMSACFSALFGTPMAAAVFSMEVVSVGIMYYTALVPCVIAALIAHSLAVSTGVAPATFILTSVPSFNIANALLISVLSGLCALISILFCVMLHGSDHLYKRFFPNPYLRAFTGGCLVLILTLLSGTRDYNGAGIDVIARCFQGQVVPAAFLLKMLFTALTLGAGYKGGEIVPSFFVGAAFGCLFGNLTGLSAPLCTAVGMGSVFCGVTNTPIASLLICFELFGYDAMPYFLLAIAFSYMLSGYYGLYSSQKIIYSKYKTQYIDRKTS